MNGWQTYWAAWALVTLGAFAIPELVAVFTDHPERKLSQAFWVLEDAVGHPLIWRLALGGVMAAIFYHLLIGPRH